MINVLAWSFLCLAALGASSAYAETRNVDGTAESSPPASGQITIDILSYNVYLRPVMAERQDVRAPLIPARLSGYDVVLLQEAFSDWHRKMILRATVEEYPFQSQVLGRDRGFRQDGGVVLLSKWPIEVESQTLFGELCARKDCLADKGVLYARINKQGRRFHVFATHLQSGKANWETRRQQLETLRRLIEQKQLPADEPVLIGGDLNVDSFADAETGDFSSMLRILDASHPAPPEGAVHQPTVDPAGNRLAGGAAPRHVDYVLHSNDHLRPITAFNAVRRLFVGDLPLSDHYAVHGSFAFEQQPLLSEAPSKQHDSRSATVDSFSKTTN